MIEKSVRFPIWLKASLIGLLIVGVVFRFVNLNHKVYSHDEVYTSIRAAGYTHAAIDQALFQNQIIPAHDLQTFQHIKPGSSVGDTVHSLAVESPQHSPLYFLITRFWMQAFDGVLTTLFHSSLTTTRSLSVLLSLAGLPLMYVLAWELFASHSVALLATTLLALSPFDVLFAQTARQYSLLTVMVIASHYALWRALRRDSWQDRGMVGRWNGAKRQRPSWLAWGWYVLAMAIGFYTHPFFGLTLVGHSIYLIAVHPMDSPRPISWKKTFLPFGLSILIALVLYSPWLVIMLTHQQSALETTEWTQVSPGLDYLVKLWTLSFTALVLDLDFGFSNPWTFLARVPIALLMLASLYTLYRRCDRSIWLFIFTSILIPFLLLVIPDLLLGGRRSAISRYLIPCYPGIQLAIAYTLSSGLTLRPQYFSRTKTLIQTLRNSIATPYTLQPTPHLRLKQWFWRIVVSLLIAASLVSLTVSAMADTWWNKVPSYFNAEIARQINAVPSPLVISDRGDDFTNTGDLLSLSYRLHPTVRLLLLQDSSMVYSPSFQAGIAGTTAIVVHPSEKLQMALEQRYGTLQPLLPDAHVWKLPH
jgi:uncharacterized membrane protein